MSTLEQRLKDAEKTAPGSNPSVKSELEKQLQAEEDELAKELQLGRAEEIIAKRRLRIQQLADMLRAGGGDMPGSEGAGKRWTVVDGKPIEDPEGEYESFAQAYKVAALNAAKATDQTALFSFLKKEGLLDLGKKDDFMSQFMGKLAALSVENIINPAAGRADAGTAEVIRSLQAEMSAMREEIRKSTDPIESAKRVVGVFGTFKELGLIHEPAPGGENIEAIKERNRHEEELAKLKLEERRGDAFANAPKVIGGAIAQGIRSRGGGAPGGEIAETPPAPGTKRPVHVIEGIPGEPGEVNCPECGEVVGIGATAARAVCAKCNAKFTIKRVGPPPAAEELAK
jgi:hypothetical protein